MFWCGVELQKQEQAFISEGSRSRDYSPTEGGITNVPVSSSEGGVTSAFVSPSEGGVASVYVSTIQSSGEVMPPDPVISSQAS